jgi:hypothetical protein
MRYPGRKVGAVRCYEATAPLWKETSFLPDISGFVKSTQLVDSFIINSLSSPAIFFSTPQTGFVFGGYILPFFWLVRCIQFFAV